MKITEELSKLKAGQAISIEGKEKTVKFVGTLNEMIQRSGSTEWVKGGKWFKVIFVSGGIWFANIPSEESGRYVWLLLEQKRYSSNLRQFYKGGDSLETWGVARKFAKSEQKEPIPYELDGQKWEVVDIGTFQVEGDGDSETAKNGDRLYFVTSKGISNWLLYLDARPGESKGTGGLFEGKEFNPNELIESVL